MITPAEASALVKAHNEAKNHEPKVDAIIRQAAMTGRVGRLEPYYVGGYDCGTLAEAIAERYRAAGWKATAEDLGIDRAHEQSIEWHVVIYR